MKNSVRKVCTRVLGFALAFSLTISNGVVALAEGAELAEKDGYIISYHNNHEWTAYGSTVPNCDNQYKETTGKECIQVICNNLMIYDVFAFRNQGSASYSRVWSGGVPASKDDPRWAECLATEGSYKMPLDIGGCAYLCTDDSVWYVRPETSYITATGDNVCNHVWTSTTENRPAGYYGGHDLNARLYFIYPSVEDCTDSRSYKYLKGVAYYYYSDGFDGRESWDTDTSSPNGYYNYKRFGFNTNYIKSSELAVSGGTYECWDDGDGFRRWFIGKNFLDVVQQQLTSTDGSNYYGTPSYALARYNYTFNGSSNILYGHSTDLRWDAEGKLIFYNNAIGGYRAYGHREYLFRWKCGGHYSPIGYKIVYDGNSIATNIYGDPCSTIYYGSVDDTDCTYDVSSTVSNNGFSKPGYTFKYWNTKADNTGKIVNPGDTILNWTTTNNAVITLYAIWEPINYGVNVYDNKPSDSTSNIVQIK